MSNIGIIAEFNPFHNGHKYLIEKSKKITKSENVVVVCSGNFVQRGEPAIFDKYIPQISTGQYDGPAEDKVAEFREELKKAGFERVTGHIQRILNNH